MVVRDNNNIIVQHYQNDPLYGENGGDGGDSSRSTGIMALFGSRIDQEVIDYHCTDKGFVRHPKQAPWNDTSNFSRDQLLCLIAGLYKAKKYKKIRREFYRQYWKGICPNGDLLGPEFYWHVILSGKIYFFYWLFPIGYLFQFLHIIWATQIDPDKEQNQTICMTTVSGLLWLWVFMHPYWKTSIRNYWSKWRDQDEIAKHIIKGINLLTS